jgi:hypothetical protein
MRLRHVGIHAKRKHRAPAVRRRLPPGTGERRLKQFALQLDPDQAQMAGLGLAKHLAGAAQVEVTCADGEARADPVHRLQGA